MNQSPFLRCCSLLSLSLVVLLGLTATLSADNKAYNHSGSSGTSHPKWMKWVPDSTPLSVLSIPATHDTLSFYGGDIAVTQSLSLKNQLKAGIRGLDIRVRLEDNDFKVYHGSIYQYAEFGTDVLKVCNEFLDDNPSETVLIWLSTKGTPNKTNSDKTHCERLEEYLDSSEGRKVLQSSDSFPTMGDIRGKILILNGWGDGADFDGCSNVGPDHDYWTQSGSYDADWDLAAVWELDDKWDEIKARLEEIDAGTSADQYRVSISANSSSGGVYPLTAANGSWPYEGMTHRLLNYLYKGKQTRTTGVVFMDFPGAALIDAIIAMNLKYAEDPIEANEDFKTIWENICYSTQITSLGSDSTAKDHRDELQTFLEKVIPGHYWNVVAASENFHVVRTGEGFSAGSSKINGYFHTAFSSSSVGGFYTSTELADYLTNSRLKGLSGGVVDRAVETQRLLNNKFPGVRWNVLVKRAPGGFANWAYSTENSAIYDSGFLSDDIRTVAWSTSITNEPPIANLTTTSFTYPEGSTAYFYGVEASDPEESPLTYLWDIDGDSIRESKTTIPLLSTKVWEDGVFRGSVSVSDGLMATGKYFDLVVTNVPPLVNAGGDLTLYVSETLSRYISISDPGILDAIVVRVDYGEGAGWSAPFSAPNRVVELDHTYHTEGTFTVKVEADDGVDKHVGTFTVAVTDPGPKRFLSLETSGYTQFKEGESIRLQGKFFNPDWVAGSDIVVAWRDSTSSDLGDTALYDPGADIYRFAGDHIYADNRKNNGGIYTIQVWSVAGGMSTIELPVLISNVAPEFLAEPLATVEEGAEVSRLIEFTDPGADTWTVEIDYGDQTSETLNLVDREFTFKHTYDTPGTYFAQMTVTDDDGDSDFMPLRINVTNRVPVLIGFNGPEENTTEGEVVNVQGSIRSPLLLHDGISVMIDWGDGRPQSLATLGAPNPQETVRSFSASHIYSDNKGGEGALGDTYQVTAFLSEEEGETISATIDVNVINSRPVVSPGGFHVVAEGGTFDGTGAFEDAGFDSWTGQVRYSAESEWVPLEIINSNFVFDHRFPDNGVYPVQIRITDDDGATASATRTVVVGTPALKLSRPSSDTSILSWTPFEVPFRLQGTTSLQFAEWQNLEISGEPEDEGEQTVEVVSEGEEDQLRFFRLVWP